jgi:hypothetical protein
MLNLGFDPSEPYADSDRSGFIFGHLKQDLSPTDISISRKPCFKRDTSNAVIYIHDFLKERQKSDRIITRANISCDASGRRKSQVRDS